LVLVTHQLHRAKQEQCFCIRIDLQCYDITGHLVGLKPSLASRNVSSLVTWLERIQKSTGTFSTKARSRSKLELLYTGLGCMLPLEQNKLCFSQASEAYVITHLYVSILLGASSARTEFHIHLNVQFSVMPKLCRFSKMPRLIAICTE